MAKLEFRKMIWRHHRDQILVGLDLGTQHTKIVVAEVREDGQLNLIGFSKVDTLGIRKGEVHHHDDVLDSIHRAVIEAEKSVDGLEINRVEISLTGRHISSFNNNGSTPILSEDKEITPIDVEDAISNAKLAALPQGHSSIHTIRQLFKVDDRDGVVDPVGLLGSRLEVGVHIIHGLTTSLQNTIRCVQAEELEVGHTVFAGLSSALAVLTPQDKQQGALVLDIGAGVTEYVAYARGTIRCTGVLPVGGKNVTNDLAVALKIPFPQAERVKLEHLNLDPNPADPDQIVTMKVGEFGLQERQFALGDIQMVGAARYEELFELVMARMAEQKLLDYLGAGIFITGGVGRTPGFRELLEDRYGIPVHIPAAQGLDGAQNPQTSPEFSTAIGLVKYSHQMRSEYQSRKRPSLISKIFGK